MRAWQQRAHAAIPFQGWMPFPIDAIVQVKNQHGESRIGPAGTFWWGYEKDLGGVADGVITRARRLDKPKEQK